MKKSYQQIKEQYYMYIDNNVKIIKYNGKTIMNDELYDIVSIINMCSLDMELKYKYSISLLNWETTLYSSKFKLTFNYNKFVINSIQNLHNIDMEGYSKLYYLGDIAICSSI